MYGDTTFGSTLRKTFSNVTGLSSRAAFCDCVKNLEEGWREPWWTITEAEIRFFTCCVRSMQNAARTDNKVAAGWKSASKFCGWVTGLIGGLPVLITMTNLVFGAIGDTAVKFMHKEAQEGEFLDFEQSTKFFASLNTRYAISLFSLAAVLSLGAIIGQAPFNTFYGKGLADNYLQRLAHGKGLTVADYNIIWNFIETIDGLPGNLLRIMGGALPLAKFLYEGLKSVFYAVPSPGGWWGTISETLRRTAALYAGVAGGLGINNATSMLVPDVTARVVDTLQHSCARMADFISGKCSNPYWFGTQLDKKLVRPRDYQVSKCMPTRFYSVRQMRGMLLHAVQKGKDGVQLSPLHMLNAINSPTADIQSRGQFLARVNQLDLPILKRLFSNVLFTGFSSFIVYEGTPQFAALGGEFFDTICSNWLRITEEYSATGLAEYAGAFSQMQFMLLWITSLQSLGQWAMRQLPNRFADLTNHDYLKGWCKSKGSCNKQTILYYVLLVAAIVGGVALAITNIALLPLTVPGIPAIVCAILSNLAVSIMGTMQGLQLMGVLDITKDNLLTWNLGDLQHFIDTEATDDEITALWNAFVGELNHKSVSTSDDDDDDDDILRPRKSSISIQQDFSEVTTPLLGEQSKLSTARSSLVSSEKNQYPAGLEDETDDLGYKITYLYDPNAIEGVHYSYEPWDINKTGARHPLDNDGHPLDHLGNRFDDPTIYDQKTGLPLLINEDQSDDSSDNSEVDWSPFDAAGRKGTYSSNMQATLFASNASKTIKDPTTEATIEFSQTFI